MKRRNFNKLLLGSLMLSSLPTSGILASPNLINKPKFPRKLQKPKHLKPGDRIALVTPGSPITTEQLARAKANVEGLGFNVVHTQNIRMKKGYLAGNDQQRAADINQFFANENIAGIWCVRGGYGSARILPYLDFKMIRKNPKVFIGYSDITALHMALVRYARLVCFHGPVAGSNWSEYTKEHLQILLQKKDRMVIRPLGDRDNIEGNTIKDTQTIQSGLATGKLVGGNLSLVTSLLGTPYELDFTNKIVFLEDIGEKPYRIDRMLTQLLLQGNLQKAAGIALGVFKNCDTTDTENSFTLNQTLTDRLFQLGMPVAYGLPFGHVRNHSTIPIGINATLDVSNRIIEFLESPVK